MKRVNKRAFWVVILVLGCCTAGAAVKVSLDSPATFPVDI